MPTSRDVFRLVGLRSADPTNTLSPVDMIEPSRRPTLPDLGPFWSNRVTLAKAVDKLVFLPAAELPVRVPWLTTAGLVEADPAAIPPRVSRPGSSMETSQYVRTAEFADSFATVTASWLVLRALRRCRRPYPAELLEVHELLLTAGIVLKRGVLDAGPPLAQLSDVVLVVPERWWPASYARPGTGATTETATATEFVARESAPGAALGPIEAKLGDTSFAVRPEALMAGLSTRAPTVEELREIALSARVVADRRGASGGQLPIDDAFVKELTARLSPGAKNELVILLGGPGEARTVGDLVTGADAAADAGAVAANRLCSSLQLYESEHGTVLPPPGQPAPGPRPAIRALGWGDLFVVREELVGYEAREISHIENVLAGESFSKDYDRRFEGVELTETESLLETEIERELVTTDRFELHTSTGETLHEAASLAIGVTTSGKYGVTQVDTSTDIALSQTSDESTTQTLSTVRDVMSKSVQRTLERVRQLRRRTVTESVRDRAQRAVENTVTGAGPNPVPRSAVYLWLEKIHRLQLHRYGTRLMIEFTIPEPGLSMIEASQPVVGRYRKPLPLQIGPGDIDETNYLCLTKHYGARGVNPPPPHSLAMGDTFVGTVDRESAEGDFVFGRHLPVPAGYIPISGRWAATGRGQQRDWVDATWPRSNYHEVNDDAIHAYIAISGQGVVDTVVDLQGSQISGGLPSFSGGFELESPIVTDEKGVPVTVRVSRASHTIGAVNVSLTCVRSGSLMNAWRLETYQKILDAHEEVEADYRRDVALSRNEEESARQQFGARPMMANRALEREELRKWSIALMRSRPFEFDAIASMGVEQGLDPVAADSQAPIVRFFEQSFEWSQMSYMLHPYFWGRTESWRVRRGISVPNDPTHEAFLRAGSARVIVPVTPGNEARVLRYLSAPLTLPEWVSGADTSPLDAPTQRIAPDALDLATLLESDVEDLKFASLWLELLQDHKPEVLRGAGRLSVTSASADIKLVGMAERVSARDIGRELYIAGEVYSITALRGGGLETDEFTVDRPYPGATGEVDYAIGSIAVGEPWTVRLPTTLVTLADNRAALKALF